MVWSDQELNVFFFQNRIPCAKCKWFCNRINQLKAVADFKFEDKIIFFVVSKSMIQINLLNWISHLLMWWYFLQKDTLREVPIPIYYYYSMTNLAGTSTWVKPKELYHVVFKSPKKGKCNILNLNFKWFHCILS